MQSMHQVWRPSGPLGSRLNLAIFFTSRQCKQIRSCGPDLARLAGRSSCASYPHNSAMPGFHLLPYLGRNDLSV